jgi:tetratricopeptide (TPR) repeat protein
LAQEAGDRKDSGGSSAHTLYDKAIKQASKILTFHSESRWVDDSLFMLGQCFFWQQKFPRADRKFDELLTFYPKSDFADEALLWRGRCLAKMYRYIEADEHLLKAAAAGKHKLTVQALLASARMNVGRGKSELVLRRLDTLLAKPKLRSADRAQIQEMVGDIREAAEDHAGALAAYQAALETESPDDASLELHLKKVRALRGLGHLDEALAALAHLREQKRFGDAVSRLLLEAGDIRRAAGDTEEALTLYRQALSTEGAISDAMAAHLRIGLVYEQDLRQYEDALEAYNHAEPKDHSSDDAAEAIQRAAQVSKLLELRALTAASGDTAAYALLQLAELWAFRMKAIDLAIATYDSLLKRFPDRPEAPRAAFAIGWIRTALQDDSAAYDRLITRYPRSPQAAAAREILGLEAVEDGRTSSALARTFAMAESLRLDGAPSGEYLPLLDRIADADAENPLGRKARFVIAWTHETVLRDYERAAALYATLANRAATDTLALLARVRLEALGASPNTAEAFPGATAAQAKTADAPPDSNAGENVTAEALTE